MHVYLGQDVCYTARLWHDLVAEANEESPRLLECHDQLLMPVSKQIARCEWVGAPIDVKWVEETVPKTRPANRTSAGSFRTKTLLVD